MLTCLGCQARSGNEGVQPVWEDVEGLEMSSISTGPGMTRPASVVLETERAGSPFHGITQTSGRRC